jgi:hypothetical protein
MNYAKVRTEIEETRHSVGGAAPKWLPNGPMRDVPHVGRFFAKRLHGYKSVGRPRVDTPADWARQTSHWLAAMPEGARRQGLGRILAAACQNPRASRCVRGYFVRDVNPGCFLALTAILSVLWGDAHVFGPGVAMPVSRRTVDAVGLEGVTWRRGKATDGSYPAASCACRSSRERCEEVASCAWRPGAAEGFGESGGEVSHCIPADPHLRGFDGVADYAGQKAPNPAGAALARKGTSYTPLGTVQWRASTDARLPNVPAVPHEAWPAP